MPAFEAIILDMDGVVTRTATLHARAWKKIFDDYRNERLASGLGDFPPFDEVSDYRAYVDGELRNDGVRGFLKSRGILLDPKAVHDLADRKQALFLKLLSNDAVETFDDAIRAISRWRSLGFKIALISSSKNCEAILSSAGIQHLFDARVDGNDLEKQALPGKPNPEIFLEAARLLHVSPSRAVVIEDAVAGVKAGRLGAFGRVVGVARETSGDDLHAAGADLVVRSLDDIHLPEHGRSGWYLSYDHWDEKSEPLRETLCTLGNGFFGTRGAAEESSPDTIHYPGTYLSGGYNRLKLKAHAFVFENEDIVNWPNWLCLSFKPDGGEWLDLARMNVLDFRQELNLESGVLSRDFRVRDFQGRISRIKSQRIVSMASPHLGALQWELIPENWGGKLTVRSSLDGRIRNNGVKKYRALENRHLDILDSGDFLTTREQRGIFLVAQSNQSHIRVAEAAITRIHRDKSSRNETRLVREPELIAEEQIFEIQPQILVRIEKWVAIYSSRDHATGDPLEAARTAVEREDGFSDLLCKHTRKWTHLWRRFGSELDGSSRVQMALRLHQFHLIQTYSFNSIERDVGIPARGIHGEGYRGHIFWDELFIFPFFNFRMPALSREMLQYRYHRLNEARQRAHLSGYHGAMYPWQSATTGEEETPKFELNPKSGRWLPERTNLQAHVGSAIAYDIWQYYQATQDREFLSYYGAEMMLEIARFWVSRSSFNPERRRYDIRGIVGPDEFHTRYPGSSKPGIDNNAYTNLMASWSIQKALYIADHMGRERMHEIQEDLSLSDEELASWDDVSRNLFIPLREDGVIEQFEGYGRLAPIDLAEYKRKYGDVQRLDLILEAEGRSTEEFDALKQADVLMLFYLFSAEELGQSFGHLGYAFEPSYIKKNIQYYLPRTVHGSTLSRGVYSWVLARFDRQMSWSLFQRALESDLSDIQGGTTPEGVHLGGMAQTIDIVQRCYSGMELRDEVLWFNPLLPDELPSVRFRVQYRGHWLSILITHKELCVSVDRSWHRSAQIGFGGQVYTLRQGELKQFHLKDRKQPSARIAG